MAAIPITIVTGFLGAGKTTLILNLLPQLRAANPSYRLALVKNEFGDVAVDSQLTAAAGASSGAGGSAISGVRELLGGCICCNLVGQLGDALRELSGAEGGGGGGARPDRIVLETSGSAFPATLALEVNRLARETGAYALDGVVSVVDVENWRGYDDTSYTARLQARYTDLVVFNKWEAAGERRFDDCLDRLGDLDADTPWVKSRRGWVGADVVFGIDGGLASGLLEAEAAGHEHAGDGHGHSHGSGEDHQTEVEVLSVTLRGPQGVGLDGEKLLKLLTTAPKAEVYRIKAVLHAAGAVRNSDDDVPPPPPAGPGARYILNWAFGRWTFTPVVAEADDGPRPDEQTALRMTVILARHESTKWKKKLEAGGLLELDGGEKGSLVVCRLV